MSFAVSFAKLLFLLITVEGIDLNSIFGRTVCFNETQKNCNKNFIDVYKHLSLSVTKLTKAETFMLLYTRKNTENPEKLHKCAGKLPPNTKFNPKNRLVVIFTPFVVGYCDTALYREWTVQLLIREDINVIIIDYGWGEHFDYGNAVRNAREIVRYQTLILLHNIQRQTGIPRKRIIFMGHSLGAQLCGLVGHYFKVSRIIGIDPAGPGFSEETPLIDRLDMSDADLVEVWHCNSGDCLPDLGINYDPGHINYHINGGHEQPNCQLHGIESLLKQDYITALGMLTLPSICSHVICPRYLTTSFNPGNCQFVAVKYDKDNCAASTEDTCGTKGENCILMGWDSNITDIPDIPQSFYVGANFNCPYCNNDYVELDGFTEFYESSLKINEENPDENEDGEN